MHTSSLRAVCTGFALAATLSCAGSLPLACPLVQLYRAFGAECSDVSDAGNSPCFSLQPPSNTNFDLVLLCFPQGCTHLGTRDLLDEDGCPEECASKQAIFVLWFVCIAPTSLKP